MYHKDEPMRINLKGNHAMRLIAAAMFIVLAVAGMGFSVFLFMVAKNIYMYAVATLIFLLSIISGFFNVFAAFLFYRSYFYDEHLLELKSTILPLKSFPTVAIAMPVFNEDPKVVKRNLESLMKMEYPKNKLRIYLLDDSTKDPIREELRAFSKKSNITYLHRANRTAFKAGNLNNMLKHSKEEFLAIFDYDEYLKNTKFLLELLPYFADKKVAYIQTQKTSSGGTFFSDCVNLFDSFFFNFIQPARAIDNTAIFAGSCGIIRRSVLDELGGFPEFIIEDTFFSFESDIHNYKGVYIPKVYAYGKPITSFSALVRQQWRYNYGDTQFIKYFLNNKPKKRSAPLWNMDYITHGFGLNYLSSMLILFTLVSVLLVFSNLPFVNINVFNINASLNLVTELEIFGAMAFILSFFLPVLLTKIYFKSLRKGFMVFLLNFALAISRTRAAIAALVGSDPTWNWNRIKGKSGDFKYSIYATRYELGFASVLFVLGYFAAMNHNISGSVWLLLYGLLYVVATVMVYKYG